MAMGKVSHGKNILLLLTLVTLVATLSLTNISAMPSPIQIDNSELVITKYDGIEAETYLPKTNGNQLCLYHKAGNSNVTSLDELRQLIQQAQDSVDNWTVGLSYQVDELVSYEGQIYKVLQAHTSQADWTPDTTASLFVEYAFQDIGEVPQWTQPTGSHDAYNIGDRVWFEVNQDKLIYESVINANVWSPTAYPAGWNEIGIINEQEVYGNESITAINELGNSIVVPRNLEEGLSTYCVNVTKRIQIGSNTIIAEWINSTYYIYPTSKLEINPFSIEVLFDGVKQEYPNLNWTSNETIDEGIPFELQINNFTQRDNVTFRQNKLSETKVILDNQFKTETKTYFIDYSKFESLNNITNKTITPNYPDVLTCVAERFPYLWQFYDCLETPTSYDITYYGNITNLDPSLEYTFTSTEYGFYNQTEASDFGARLDNPYVYYSMQNEYGYAYEAGVRIYYNDDSGNGRWMYPHNSDNPYTADCGVPWGNGGCWDFTTGAWEGDVNQLNENSFANGWEEITIAGWFNTSDIDANEGWIFSRGADYWGFYGIGSTDKLRFYMSDGTTQTYAETTGAIPLNEWVYIVGTWKAGEAPEIYINGVLNVTGGTTVANGISQNDELLIGEDVSSGDFDGYMAGVVIDDRAWSAEEIDYTYNSGSGDKNGKYMKEGDFESLVFYNSTSTYWNTTLSLADSNGSAEVYDLCNADANCVSYWDLDDNANGVLDAKGSNDGTPTGTNNATGLSSGALWFDGDDKITINNMGLETSQCWWNKNNSATNWNFNCNVSGTTYLNGEIGTPDAYVLSLSGSDLLIGDGYTGIIDEVLIYNDTLTASEVDDLYKAGLSQHANANVTLETRTADSYNLSDSGLVSLWSFNAGDGTDETGRNDANTVSGISFNEGNGTVGYGSYFDGGTDYLEVTNPVGFDTNNITVAFWVKRDQTSDLQYFLERGTQGVAGQFNILFEANDKISVDIPYVQADVVTSTNTITDTDWHHVTYKRRGDVHYIYIDGEIDNSNTDASSFTTSGYLRMGRYGTDTTNDFKGSLDEVRIYNRSLSADEVSNLYALGNYHIEWGDWEDEGKMNDLVADTSNSSGNFFQYRANFNTNDTDVSAYVLNYSVTYGEAPVTNTAPNNVTAVIESGDGTNGSQANLNCSGTVSDPDGDNLNATIRFYKNNVLNLTINDNSNYANGSLIDTILLAGNLSVGDIWNCSIEVTDGTFNSTPINSNGITILDDILPYFTTIPPSGITDYKADWLGADFDATDDDSSIDYWWINATGDFEINQTGYLKQNTSRTLNASTYKINVSINDTSGNVNSTVYELLVNKLDLVEPTDIEITADPADTINYGEDFTIDGLIHIVEIEDTGNLFINSTTPNNVTNPYIYESPPAGKHLVTFNTSGNNNYNPKEITRLLTVNKIAPDITNLWINNTQDNYSATTPIGSQVENVYINFTAGGDETPPPSDYTVKLNGTLLATHESDGLNYFNLTNLSAGYYNVTMNVPESQNYTETEVVYWINITEVDITPPKWKDNQTNLTSNTLFGESVEFNITFTDNDGTGYYILSHWNGTNWTNESASSWANNTVNTDILTLDRYSGYYNWTYYFNDSSGNTNQTDIFSVYLNDIPVISDIYPTNGQTYTSLLTISNFTMTVQGDGDKCWYSLDGGTTNSSTIDCNSTGSYNFTSVNFVEGSNTITIYANNTMSEVGSASSTFTIDLPPTVNIVSPTTADQNLVFEFEMSCSDTQGVSNQWYSWKGTNYTYTGPLDLYASAGDYTIDAFCNDTIGSLSTDSVSFTARDFDTNATTDCSDGYYLDGDGNCVLIPTCNSSAKLEYNGTDWSCIIDLNTGSGDSGTTTGSTRCYYQLFGKYDSSIKSFMRYPYGCVE